MVELNSLKQWILCDFKKFMMQITELNQNMDPAEIHHFRQLGKHWWDKEGPMKMLHAVNPIRTAFILDCTELANKTVLDIGCGAGILSEALASHQAKVLGIDMAQEAIEAAQAHAKTRNEPWLNTSLHYQLISAEDLALSQPNSFDIITCMECLEHVPDPLSIIKACRTLLKPNGYLLLSTLNRTPKSYLQAIIGAEYILNMIPKGTHHYEKFIRPHEMHGWARSQGFMLKKLAGIQYHPITKNFSLSQDVSVNYLACYQLEDKETL